jgi:NAD(P)H-hydrate epimerase
MMFMTRAQMREYDRLAIEHYGVPGVVLMENAGRGAANVVESLLSPTAPVAIVAGGGNNGGDGFVVARHLTNRGHPVRVYLVAPRNKLSRDAQTNLHIFSKMGGVVLDCPAAGALASHQEALDQAEVIVDALLGTGLTRDVQGPALEAIELLNRLAPPKVALDIPSGVCSDSGHVLGAAVRAVATATFGFLKRGLLLFPGAEMAGAVHVVGIGAPLVAADRAGHDGQLLQEGDVRGLLRPRAPNSHKGSFGHLLIMAGGQGKTGAAILCAESAMRAGAGLVTLVSSLEGQRALETKTREVMLDHVLDRTDSPLSEKAVKKLGQLLEGKRAIAVGPGCSTHPAVASLVARLLAEAKQPMVVDADALTILADNPNALRDASGELVLTPHPGEMARLMGTDVTTVQADRVGAARSQAERFGAVVVLKGAHTVIATPDGKLFINPTGNPGMASGGSGDVLTGLIGAFLAQGMDGLEAACLGVYLHGFAGDQAACTKGERGLVATDLIDAVPAILRAWENGEPFARA